MKLIIACIVYASALTAANLSIAQWGPWVSPINSFFLIGLDLTLRDWLHMRISKWQMFFLIIVSGIITFALNPASEMIAIASAVAFTSAAVVDWQVFTRVKGSWFGRANKSNVAGALVDSIMFPTVAFGVLMPHIIAMQFLAKLVGWFVWAFAIDLASRRKRAYAKV